MLDTHAVARSLTDADFTPAQADALTNAIRLAADHGDHVTSDQIRAAYGAWEKRDPSRNAGRARTVAQGADREGWKGSAENGSVPAP